MSKARSAVAALSLQPMARRIRMRRARLTQAETRDDQEAEPEGQRKAEAELDPRDRRRLAGDGEPAQPDEGVEAQVAGVVGQVGRVDSDHRAERIGLLRPSIVATSAGAAGRLARRVKQGLSGAMVRQGVRLKQDCNRLVRNFNLNVTVEGDGPASRCVARTQAPGLWGCRMNLAYYWYEAAHRMLTPGPRGRRCHEASSSKIPTIR